MTSAREFYLQESLKPVLREPLDSLLDRQQKILSLKIKQPLITSNKSWQAHVTATNYKLSMDTWLGDYWPDHIPKETYLTRMQRCYFKVNDGDCMSGQLRHIFNMLREKGYVERSDESIVKKIPLAFEFKPRIQYVAESFAKLLPERFTLQDLIEVSQSLKLHPYYTYEKNRDAYKFVTCLRYVEAIRCHARSISNSLAIYILIPENFPLLKDASGTPKRNRGL